MLPTNKKTYLIGRKSFALSSILLLLLLLIVLTPLAVYLATFGVSLSKSHSVWSEFGSAMSGIYAPIIALATLCVLVAQFSLQKQIYAHETELAYIHQARTDVEFYCTHLVKVMERMIFTDQTTRAALHQSFQPDTVDKLDGEECRKLAAEIYGLVPETVDLWAAIFPILGSLTFVKTVNCQMTLNLSKQKLIGMLSYETCVCLDNLYRARSQGKIKVDYNFSPLLSN